MAVMLILALVAAFAVYAWLRHALRKRRLSVQQFFAIYAAIILGALLVFMGVTGRLHPLFAALGAALPVLLRVALWVPQAMQLASLYRLFKSMGAQPAPGSGQGQGSPKVSEVSSRYLHMTLHHSDGRMDGKVLAGRHAGQRLADLPLPELIALLQEIADDADSVNLLTAYLERMHPDWRTGADPGAAPMTEAEALRILGLGPRASKEDIIAAHRQKMQRAHPDRGGSTADASRLNAARDLLLRQRGKGKR